MKFKHTSTVDIHEFIGAEIPPYAILSHTWAAGEVSFVDMREHREAIMATAGFDKIRMCCQKAASDGFEYVWIDTCCIDKSSTTELSEAINSMFRWYQNAQVCYAYLAEMPSGENLRLKDDALARSRWFTRGWTL